MIVKQVLTTENNNNKITKINMTHKKINTSSNSKVGKK